MSISKTEKTNLYKLAQRRKDRATEIANTFEWLIIAFVLAFVFRAFAMEAFRIPTGSMAGTLKGAHFRLRCPQCGYKYDYGFVPQHFGFRREDYIPTSKNLKLHLSRCPSCGHYQPTGGAMPVANGDRILVLKCIYQFVEPMRWDVIVFKNPLEPSINYIKRLVGKPGETIEIIATYGEHIYIPSVVLGELTFGFMKGKRQHFNEKKLRQVISRLEIKIIDVTADVARKYAIIYLTLAKKGTKIPINDVWIAACCMEKGGILLTRDKHFEYVDQIESIVL